MKYYFDIDFFKHLFTFNLIVGILYQFLKVNWNIRLFNVVRKYIKLILYSFVDFFVNLIHLITKNSHFKFIPIQTSLIFFNRVPLSVLNYPKIRSDSFLFSFMLFSLKTSWSSFRESYPDPSSSNTVKAPWFYSHRWRVFALY